MSHTPSLTDEMSKTLTATTQPSQENVNWQNPTK